MEYYHIVVKKRIENTVKKVNLLGLDKTIRDVRHVAVALAKKKAFLFEGEKISQTIVSGISIFKTLKPSTELILPNGISIADYKNSECKPAGCCKHVYISKCLEKGQMKGIADCTRQFILNRRERNGAE